MAAGGYAIGQSSADCMRLRHDKKMAKQSMKEKHITSHHLHYARVYEASVDLNLQCTLSLVCLSSNNENERTLGRLWYQ